MKTHWKISKLRSRIRQVEWNRACRYYNWKYQQEIERLWEEFLLEGKRTREQQKRESDRVLDEKKDAIKSLRRQIKKMRKEHAKYMELKTELEVVKDRLSPAFDRLKIDVIDMFKLFKGNFDKIEYLGHRHNKIKEIDNDKKI